ncbi:uncharacterized protein prob1 isoform X3 [Labrus mixtus]|uniref:uncharacterized protein prob1 isoform X3 n=1 Tax=Labrus mixtus TaxID=508554 RepID=UPI0029BFBB26|nr:uncharacterized protein prob1 isoform X3 [Labrus mixtus]
MDRGGEKLIFLSAHRCPEVDALPHHDFVTHDPPSCSLVPAERSSRFTCAGDSETNYFDVSPSCGFDKEEDEEEERSVSDWSEEDLSLHFAPSVILRSDDDESDPESGFECIDVTMETLVQGQKGEGLKMVPKRQIQLKKKDVKNAEKLQVKPTNGSCEGGGAYCEMLCPPVRPDVLRRQHSMPASLQTSSDADSYRVCRGLAAGASQDNIKEHDTVSSYISFCVDNIIPSKTVTIFTYNTPWITKELKVILNKKKRVFFTGSEMEKKEVNKEVKHAIKTVKLKYKNKVEEKFTQGNLRSAWQGLKNMAAVNTPATNNKIIQVAGGNPSSLPNDLI